MRGEININYLAWLGNWSAGKNESARERWERMMAGQRAGQQQQEGIRIGWEGRIWQGKVEKVEKADIRVMGEFEMISTLASHY
jgi:hypothetical protein